MTGREDVRTWGREDNPKSVRPGEELDTARLLDFVGSALPELSSTDISVQQFPGGFSNLTFLVRLGDVELVLRRPPRGAQVKGGHDMAREYGLLAALHGPYGRVPKPLVYCDDVDVIGAPFYMMERVRGMIIRGALPGDMDAGELRGVSQSLMDTLSDLHAFDWRAAGLDRIGKPDGYVARQVDGWTTRYAAARTDDVPALERVAAWLAEHKPGECGASLIHNDFKYDNVVLDPEQPSNIRAVLDWEMATIGDPLMDLGTSLAYWIDADDPVEMRSLLPGVSSTPGNLTRRDAMEQYAMRSGRDVGSGVFYYAFGLFKTAVILQQIYARYRAGLTTDPRFAALGAAVQGCALGASLAIDKQRIDHLTQ